MSAAYVSTGWNVMAYHISVPVIVPWVNSRIERLDPEIAPNMRVEGASLKGRASFYIIFTASLKARTKTRIVHWQMSISLSWEYAVARYKTSYNSSFVSTILALVL
jgi:hypothetical protein